MLSKSAESCQLAIGTWAAATYRLASSHHRPSGLLDANHNRDLRQSSSLNVSSVTRLWLWCGKYLETVLEAVQLHAGALAPVFPLSGW